LFVLEATNEALISTQLIGYISADKAVGKARPLVLNQQTQLIGFFQCPQGRVIFLGHSVKLNKVHRPQMQMLAGRALRPQISLFKSNFVYNRYGIFMSENRRNTNKEVSPF